MQPVQLSLKNRSEFSRFLLRLFSIITFCTHLVEKKKDAIDASEGLFSDSDQDPDPLPSKRPRKGPASAGANEWSFAEGEKGYHVMKYMSIYVSLLYLKFDFKLEIFNIIKQYTCTGTKAL